MLRLFLFTAAVAIALLGPAGSALAHPFGDPQTVDVSVDDDAPEKVRLHWRIGMTDDLSWLALYLGLLPEDRVMLDGALIYQDTDGALLEQSPAFDDYLLSHLAVSSGGQACPGTVTDKLHVDTAGVTLDFACPGPVRSAAVEVTMLTDLNEAYTTLATGPDGQRFAYSAATPTNDWALGPADGVPATHLGRSALLQIGAVLGGLVLASVLAGLIWHRRRGRSPQTVTS